MPDLKVINYQNTNNMQKEENLKTAETQALNIPDVRQRCINFANWLKVQNLMICTGYAKEDATWRSSMIGGKKFTAEELYDIFDSGGNVA